MKNIAKTPARLLGLLLLVDCISQASDVSSYVVEKGVDIVQTNSGTAYPASNNGFIFQALVECSTSNTVTSATVRPPTGVVETLVEQPGNDQFQYKGKLDSQGQLDTAFPNGTYGLNIATVHDGTRTPSLVLQGDSYPNSPHLLTFTGAQALDAGAYFNFHWEYLTDGVVPDFVQLRIENSAGNKVFETADSGVEALTGAANSFLLQPGTLAANQVYNATLLARRTTSTNDSNYPGALGSTYYYRRLKFAVQTIPAASSPDVRIYSALKTEIYQQSPTNAPVALANNGFVFQALVVDSALNSVTAASLTPPPPATITNLAPSSDQFELKLKFDTLSALDAAFTAGTYTFDMTGRTQGPKSVAMQMPADSFPPAPQFLNVSLSQGLDPARDFLFQWQPFAGGTSADFIQLRIEDLNGNKIFETSDPGKAGALTGLQTSAQVPSNTLTLGSSYSARLTFLRTAVLNTTNYPGALGLVGFARETRLNIFTVPAPRPRLANSRYAPAGTFSFSVLGTAGQVYRIETSPDLITWTTAGTVALTNGQAQFTNPTASFSSSKFYRAAQP